jgi:hypothetical protein
MIIFFKKGCDEIYIFSVNNFTFKYNSYPIQLEKRAQGSDGYWEMILKYPIGL